jgi:hypothetical protein
VRGAVLAPLLDPLVIWESEMELLRRFIAWWRSPIRTDWQLTDEEIDSITW